jgi:hypothetical protein
MSGREAGVIPPPGRRETRKRQNPIVGVTGDVGADGVVGVVGGTEGESIRLVLVGEAGGTPVGEAPPPGEEGGSSSGSSSPGSGSVFDGGSGSLVEGGGSGGCGGVFDGFGPGVDVDELGGAGWLLSPPPSVEEDGPPVEGTCVGEWTDVRGLPCSSVVTIVVGASELLGREPVTATPSMMTVASAGTACPGTSSAWPPPAGWLVPATGRCVVGSSGWLSCAMVANTVHSAKPLAARAK